MCSAPSPQKIFDAFQNSTDAQRTFREIMFLQELTAHENIIRLLNVLKADNGARGAPPCRAGAALARRRHLGTAPPSSRPPDADRAPCARTPADRDIYLVFEYMETDLHAVIRANILENIHKQYIMYQLFKALKYMHSAELLHR